MLFRDLDGNLINFFTPSRAVSNRARAVTKLPLLRSSQ